MANTCSICRHDLRPMIETLMARGYSLRHIASQFGVGYKSVERHQECVSEILGAARRRRDTETAINVNEQINLACLTMSKLRLACENYLADPDNPDRFTLDARAGEIMVIFDELAPGANRPSRKRATLSSLLVRAEKLRGVTVDHTESKYADPRQLIINTMRQMTAQLDVIAKLQGLYKQPAINPLDQHFDLIAIKMEEQREQGREITREEADRLVREETDEFIRLARKTGQDVQGSELIQ